MHECLCSALKMWIQCLKWEPPMCYSHCYVIWCPLTMRIVPLQFRSSRGVEHMMCYLRPLTSGCLNGVKAILVQWNIFTINLQTSLNFMLFIWPQWINKSHWNSASAWHTIHAHSFVTNEVTWCLAYVAKLGPLPWKNWCNFATKPTQSCCNTFQWMLFWMILYFIHSLLILFILSLCWFIVIFSQFLMVMNKYQIVLNHV